MFDLRTCQTYTRNVGAILTLFTPMWISGVIIAILLGFVHGTNLPTHVNGKPSFAIRNNRARFTVEIVAMITALVGYAKFPYYSEATGKFLAVLACLVFIAQFVAEALGRQK